jgi:acetylornithine deacetylase/succinyl-diaminopimelate desuccinylase-like protein
MDQRTEIEWARDELAALVGIASFSGSEGEILGHLRRRADALDLPYWEVPTPGGHANLVFGDRNPSVVIVAHVDTIRPDWNAAVAARVEGSVVHGLGAVDDKGGVAACLGALVHAQGSGIDIPTSSVAVAFAVDEEMGGTGSMALAAALRPTYAIALEGTKLSVVTAEAGFVDAHVRFHGRSAHGSLFELGDNAVHKLGAFIAGLDSIPAGGEVAHPLIGGAATSVLEAHGGSDENTIPHIAELKLTTRLVPPLAVAPTRSELIALAEKHGGVYEEIEVSEPFETEPSSPLVLALRAATERVTGTSRELGGMQSWTDAHSFNDIAGSQAVVFGPGDLGVAHRPDEHIDAAEVAQCARIFEALFSDPSLRSAGARVGAGQPATGP